MNEEIIKKTKESLEKRKKEIESRLKETSQKTTDNGYVAKFPDYGDDEESAAMEFEDYDEKFSLDKNLVKDLKKINEALKRIEDGKYGICSSCGHEIDENRLKAYPAAILCMDCKKKSRS